MSSWRRGPSRRIVRDEQVFARQTRQEEQGKGIPVRRNSMSEGTEAGNCMSWGAGNSNYSGSIARVGTRGCGWRGRQRPDVVGKPRAGGISEACQG